MTPSRPATNRSVPFIPLLRLATVMGIVGVAALSATRAASPPARPTTGPATAPAADVAGDVAVDDADGVARRPLRLDGAKAACFLFVAAECPISNSYAPEINRLCAEYAGRGVAFYVVHPDPDLAPADARAHAKAFGFACPVLMDGRHTLADRFGVAVTPEAVVVGPGGSAAYVGRIDDTWADFGKRRPQPTTRDLRAALDAVLTGKPAPVERTKTVGCPI